MGRSKGSVAIAIALLALMGIVGIGHTGINDGLVAYYPFNGNANDESGNGNHATSISSYVTFVPDGVFGGAAQFVKGSDSGITIPHSSSLDITGGITIAAWVNLDGCGDETILSKSDHNTNEPYVFWSCFRGAGMGAWFDGGSSGDLSNYRPPVGRWTHIAMTYDGIPHGTTNFYVDGNLVSSMQSNANGIVSNTSNMHIGASPCPGPEDFAGLMDELRLYNRALSEAEIQELYGGGTVILYEDFEDGALDNRIHAETTGTLSDLPGIKNTSLLGSGKAFGFGRSICGADCWDGFVTKLTITFPAPTYVSFMSFKEMELYGNWGSEGYIFIDGTRVEEFCGVYSQSFGRCPINDWQADTTYRTKQLFINQVVSSIELRSWDITNQSEIYIDDLMIMGANEPAEPTLTVTVDPPQGGGVRGYGIYCSPDGQWVCESSYEPGTQVTLTTQANSGWSFDHWEDGSTQESRTITMDTIKNVTATFVKWRTPVDGISYCSCPVDTGTGYDSSNPATWYTMAWSGKYTGRAQGKCGETGVNRCEGTGGHPGVDILPRTTSSRAIRAIGAGTVIESNYSSGFGNYVIIEHQSEGFGTFYSVYGHLLKDSFLVKAGKQIDSPGTRIGTMGSSGNSSGVHLHFQIDKELTPEIGKKGNILYYKPYWTTYTVTDKKGNRTQKSYPSPKDGALISDQLQEAAQNVDSNTYDPIWLIDQLNALSIR